MDFVLRVLEDGKYVCLIGAENFNYDDVIWSEMKEFIDHFDGRNVTKEDIKNELGFSEYLFVIDEEYENDEYYNVAEIDLIKRTYTLDEPLNIYDFDDEFDQFELVKKNDNYFAKYDEDCLMKMPKVNFENTKLLDKKTLSFDEYLELASFFISLVMNYDLTDFILNDNKVISLNCISI